MQITSLRRKRGMSRKELSEKTGFTETTLYRWEKGMRSPNVEAVLALCKALEVSPDELLGDPEDPPEPVRDSSS